MRINLLLDVIVILFGAAIVVSLLGTVFLVSTNLPTGGDTASHLLYAWTFAKELLPSGHLTAWMPESFTGFPFLSYYFPMPYIVIAILDRVLPFGVAMKLGMFAASILFPGAIWMGSVYLLRLPRSVAIWGVGVALAFLLHEENSIWGGNLLSTLAGEFAYSYGVLFGILSLCAWQRTIATGQRWWLAALLEAATGFSHGFAVLVVGFSTTAFVFDRSNGQRNLVLLFKGHSLAFCLLGGWLWPLLEMHSLTTPDVPTHFAPAWQALLPEPFRLILIGGILALGALALVGLLPSTRSWFTSKSDLLGCLRPAAFMASAALATAALYLAGGLIGLVDFRFFPFVWLCGGLACAWLWGTMLAVLVAQLPGLSRFGLALIQLAAAVTLAGWIAQSIERLPDWGLWNHAGLESKPQWQQLTKLFPALTGQLASPRLLFENNLANSDIGSRSLESLPMFLGGRSVLEGLYQQPALVAPAIYQLQSEVSLHPSSVLTRFPSGQINVAMAAEHMRFFYSNEVLVRSNTMKRLLAESDAFEPSASAPPFTVFRLKDFTSHLVDLPQRPLRWLPMSEWRDQAYRWFRSPERFQSELPVFHNGPPSRIRDREPAPCPGQPLGDGPIHDLVIERHRLRWCTEAVGQPHLVRMAWHLRWHLASKGSVYLAGPGFMLVIPEEPEVVLRYEQTTIGLVGMVASLIAGLILLALVGRSGLNPAHPPILKPSSHWPQDGFALAWLLLLALAGIFFYQNHPERLFAHAREALDRREFTEAAALFERAYRQRRSDSLKAEALFWAAWSYRKAGQAEAALDCYRWLVVGLEDVSLPASLDEANGWPRLVESLKQQFPDRDWTNRLSKDEVSPALSADR
ncbi:MAG: hypothetical protein H6974_01655 [Gammaproteobacteria bacterium]|nr:hypothetical protein [Gammaproteobacteria bacterium]MCP5195492.1 hypothetical protein [Gammaproteobacteria bacterium]